MSWHVVSEVYKAKLGSPARKAIATKLADYATTVAAEELAKRRASFWATSPNTLTRKKVASSPLPTGNVTRGTKLYLEGQLTLSRYRKDGAERVNLQIAASKCEPLGIGRNRQKPPRQQAPAANDAEPEQRPSMLTA